MIMFNDKIDLFHLYIHKKRNERLSSRETIVLLKDLLISFVKDIARIILAMIRSKKKRAPDFKGKKIVFATTFNNYAAVKFLLHKYPDALLVCSGGFVRKIPSAINVR